MINRIQAAIFVLFILLFSLPVNADDDVESTETPTENGLLNQDLLAIIQPILQSNEDCQLPCFFGFVPGVTRVEDVVDFWATTFDRSLEIIPSDDGRAFASFWANFDLDGFTDFSTTMTFKNEVLRLLNVSTSNTWLEDDWLSLQTIIQESSSKSFFVRVRVPSTVSLEIIIPQSNILIEKTYHLQVRGNTISSESTEPLLLCPTTDNLIRSELWLLDDEMPISIEEILGNKVLLGSELAPYQSIEFMTNLNSEEFSALIEQNPGECVEMLSFSTLFELKYPY